MKNNIKNKAYEYLKQNRIFCSCSDEDIKKLIDGSIIKPFLKEQIIFSPKNNERCIGVILKGQASVSKGNQNEVILSRLQTGELFGSVTLFSSQNYFINTIKATNACTVMFISYKSVLNLMKREPSVWQNYICYLSDRIYFLNNRIDEFTACKASSSLAKYISEYIKDNDEATLPVSMISLSKVLNIGRSSLYRAFDELEQSGAIKRTGKKIIILNRNILKKHAR